MEKKPKNGKPSFLDVALKRIYQALQQMVSIVESDSEEMEDVKNFLEDVRKELIQSFKNGIEVGIKRAHQIEKRKQNGPTQKE
jgi:hypothetical protein